MNNALNDFTLIELSVARLMGTWNFLIGHFNGHAK